MPKRLRLKPYIDQRDSWPDKGQVILAQYDDETVVVYQAYKDEIAKRAAERQTLAVPAFSMERMSWIKPNFLWMMHHSEWATAADQKCVLAIWVQRAAFDSILAQAVPSRFDAGVYANKSEWERATEESEVRVQWDPNYTPTDQKMNLRAIQIGLRGGTLKRFASEWIVQIEDITPFVREQAGYLPDEDLLFTPVEKIYPVKDREVAKRLGLDKSAAS